MRRISGVCWVELLGMFIQDTFARTLCGVVAIWTDSCNCYTNSQRFYFVPDRYVFPFAVFTLFRYCDDLRGYNGNA